MSKQNEDVIFNYWETFVKKASKPIQDWLRQESIFLKKNITKNSIVLDVGAGYGRNVLDIAKIAKKIIGIDKSKFIIDATSKIAKKYKNVEFYCQDALKINYPNNSFDYVLCLGNTFGNLDKDKISLLKEMERVCKKGGKIYICVYSDKALTIRLKEYKKIGIHIKKIKGGIVYNDSGQLSEQFSKTQLKRLFKKVGLEANIIELTSISYMCVAIK